MKHLGYRIVSNTPNGLVTIYGQDPVDSRVGSIEQPGGEGLFLGNTPSFAVDYYSGLTDYPDVLLTYEFSDDDLINGEPQSSDSEMTVRRAKLVGKKLLEEGIKESVAKIRHRAGLPD